MVLGQNLIFCPGEHQNKWQMDVHPLKTMAMDGYGISFHRF